MEYWGYHLILDCKNGELEKVKSADSIKSFVQELVKKIDMIKLPKYKEPSKKVNNNFKNENIHINPIDFYFSNSISRASKVMSECRDIKLKYQKSGTNN